LKKGMLQPPVFLLSFICDDPILKHLLFQQKPLYT